MSTQVASQSLRGCVGGHLSTIEPLRACASLWRARNGTGIAWSAASPGDMTELARRHDLLVIDHGQLGRWVGEGCLLPLNRPDRTRDLVRLAGQSVGASFVSYRMAGDQYALPLEAGAQMQCWRPDRLAGPVASWDDLLTLARHGRVLLPLRPPHSLLTFLTLTANLGQPCGMMGEAELNDATFGAAVLDRLRALLAHVDPACFALDAAAVCARIARPDAVEHCAPFADGRASDARPGNDAAPLGFAGNPAAGNQGPVGAVLAGCGIAVSAFTAQPEAALAFAYWAASGDVQRGPYADAGGQPANAAAWNDAALDAANGGFYRATRETLEHAVMRPRHAGWPAYLQAGAERLNAGLVSGEDTVAIMTELNSSYAASFA